MLVDSRFAKFLSPAIAIVAFVCTVHALAQAPKPQSLIKWRQSAFQVMAWNVGRIEASLEGRYDRAEILASATVIAALANAGIATLFVPGTETGMGWHDTSAKPELFNDRKRFNELDASFAKDANELVKVANDGTGDAVRGRYAALAKACKVCHREFKIRE
ncbi:hypothetical protein BH11PSE11_BH11PSE11_01910 [soil metagenome]